MSEQILACLECQTITDTVGPDGCCESCLLDSHEIYLAPLVRLSDLEALKAERDQAQAASKDAIDKLAEAATRINRLKADNAELRERARQTKLLCQQAFEKIEELRTDKQNLRVALSNMVEDGDTTDEQMALDVLAATAPALAANGEG